MNVTCKTQPSGFILVLGLVFLSSTCTQAQTMQDDLRQKTSVIHWPKNYTPQEADLFAHNTIDINKPCQDVWQILINVNDWPNWYSNATNIRIQGQATPSLQPDSRFSWTTFGLQVESQVAEFKTEKRLAWYGRAENINAYHTWYLQAQTKGCRLITEEVVKGKGAIAWRQQDEGAMHKGHDIWLQQLKTRAERKPGL